MCWTYTFIIGTLTSALTELFSYLTPEGSKEGCKEAQCLEGLPSPLSPRLSHAGSTSAQPTQVLDFLAWCYLAWSCGITVFSHEGKMRRWPQRTCVLCLSSY